MKSMVMRLSLGALLLAAPSLARADHFDREDDEYFERDGRGDRGGWDNQGDRGDWGEGWNRNGRAQWVMTFSLSDCGELVLESRGRSAAYLAAGSHNGRFACGPYCAAGPNGIHIVVTSNRPFGMPRGFARKQMFNVRSQWTAQHTRRLCKLLGVRPGSVRVVTYGCEPEFRRQRDQHVHAPTCVHSAWPWAGLSVSDQVYVDGMFRGAGLAALVNVGGGNHQVTVVSQQGRKNTGWVTFQDGPCGPSCALGFVSR